MTENKQRSLQHMLFSVVGLLAIFPTHFALFSLALPASFRTFLGLSFKANLMLQFLFAIIVGLFLGRYIPVVFLGAQATINRIVIETKYKRRGYRRARGQFRVPSSNEIEQFSFKTMVSRLAKFTVRDARFDNFIKVKVQLLSPIRQYEEHKTLITTAISIVATSVIYVGILRSVFVIILLFMLALIYSVYDDSKDSRFWILKSELYDDQTKDEQNTSGNYINMARLPSIIALVVIISGTLGYLRCDYLASANKFSVFLSSATTPVNIVGKTANGLIAYSKTSSEYQFIPFSFISLSENNS